MSKNTTSPKSAPRLIRKTVPMLDARFKLDDDDAGGFTGYGSVFGNVDLGGDRIVRGAFAKHLAGFVSEGFIAEGHDWRGLGIGYVADAKEDDYGLAIAVKYFSDDGSQAVRRKVSERMNAGKSVGLSIGYYVHDAQAVEDPDGRMVYELREVEVKEVSVVTVPMNPYAGVTSAKGVLTLPEEAEVVESATASLLQRLKDRAELRERETPNGKESRTLSRENVRFLYSEADAQAEAGQSLLASAKRLREFAEAHDKDKSKANEAEELRRALELERLRLQHLITITRG